MNCLFRAHLDFLNLSLIRGPVHLGDQTGGGEQRQHPRSTPANWVPGAAGHLTTLFPASPCTKGVVTAPASGLPRGLGGLAGAECLAQGLEHRELCKDELSLLLSFLLLHEQTPHFRQKSPVCENLT